MVENKLFTRQITVDTNNLVSKVKYNREYLLSSTTAEELNTYLSFGVFPVFTDSFDTTVDKDQAGNFGSGGVRSIFNKAGAVILGGTHESGKNIDPTAEDSEFRISNNVPLMDNPANRRAIKEWSGCSVKELVQASQEGRLGRATYDYSDFMYCKHLGKISNNYMITLRRFPVPVDDYISTMGTALATDKDVASKNSTSIGCMVTWMGTPGNEMSNILKYSVSMPFKSQEAQWEENNQSADQQTDMLNGIAAMFDKTYRQQYTSGQAGPAANGVLNKFFPKLGNGPYPVRDFAAWRDKNKVYGPVDAIKSTYIRSESGINFEQNISLTFDYELRSYNGINGRQAFLDLLSNILNVTYTTGSFWGGGYRSTGAHQNNIFTNMEIFKCKGGVTDFIQAFSKDLSKLGQESKNAFPKTPKDLVKAIANAANQLGGMIIGGMLNQYGRPHKVMLNSLLSPAPVGFWHVTVGNPHHPIMSMGNMILKQATIEHYGPLGLDDFPTGIKVTCELTRGKPRDITDIEKLYMHGNDRVYHPMGPKIFDMYNYSKEYKSNGGVQTAEHGDPNITLGTDEKETVTTISDIGKTSKVLQKYFGHTDTYSIYFAAAEQGYGANKTSQKDYNKKQHGGKQT